MRRCLPRFCSAVHPLQGAPIYGKTPSEVSALLKQAQRTGVMEKREDHFFRNRTVLATGVPGQSVEDVDNPVPPKRHDPNPLYTIGYLCMLGSVDKVLSLPTGKDEGLTPEPQTREVVTLQSLDRAILKFQKKNAKLPIADLEVTLLRRWKKHWAAYSKHETSSMLGELGVSEMRVSTLSALRVSKDSVVVEKRNAEFGCNRIMSINEMPVRTLDDYERAVLRLKSMKVRWASVEYRSPQ
eukprot:TRINITY_DN13859_c0_g1_i1.p1 TRINITY_DN13859_c0_g1~~TRINITY_DN13859_c0_g1_i1.p1  ORF type:complete len:240 (+),score=50.05 TRINITY_DN13859_c0_g1_i1:57-776(+)